MGYVALVGLECLSQSYSIHLRGICTWGLCVSVLSGWLWWELVACLRASLDILPLSSVIRPHCLCSLISLSRLGVPLVLSDTRLHGKQVMVSSPGLMKGRRAKKQPSTVNLCLWTGLLCNLSLTDTDNTGVPLRLKRCVWYQSFVQRELESSLFSQMDHVPLYLRKGPHCMSLEVVFGRISVI